MEVGYTIISLQDPSQKRAFVKFLKDTLILEEGYANNIAEVLVNGDSINIYTQRRLDEALSGEDFRGFVVDYSKISVEEGEYLVASAVDFRVEVQFQGEIKVLAPTEFFVTTESLARTLTLEVEQGILKIYPAVPNDEGSEWLLSEGSWNDEGIWMDEENWKDHE